MRLSAAVSCGMEPRSLSMRHIAPEFLLTISEEYSSLAVDRISVPASWGSIFGGIRHTMKQK